MPPLDSWLEITFQAPRAESQGEQAGAGHRQTGRRAARGGDAGAKPAGRGDDLLLRPAPVRLAVMPQAQPNRNEMATDGNDLVKTSRRRCGTLKPVMRTITRKRGTERVNYPAASGGALAATTRGITLK
jgi:hypothetical protein